MKISVIIPIFNAGNFIQSSVDRLRVYLSSKYAQFEIILVNDGSTDKTLAKLLSMECHNIIIIDLPVNQGKFAAIRKGTEVAKGSCILFTDADIPYELEAISYMEFLINDRNFHLVIGDRKLKGSKYQETLPFIRRICTSLFSNAVRLLVTGELFDTQCGLKGFRSDIAKELFPLVQDNRFAADVELLYVALKYNLEIRRIPVRLQRHSPSTVQSVRDGWQMLISIVSLNWKWARKQYRSQNLFDAGKQFYWDS